ncbi:MAG: helix-turn-helix transcriptional regulator [Planctomycetota bacterium]
MSIADDFVITPHFTPGTNSVPTPAREAAGSEPPAPAEAVKPRHRLAQIRQRQGISIRSAARRMGVTMEQVRREERPDSDPTLSVLARWQVALEVPLNELLIDNDAPLSAPIIKRAKWLRLMKTVKALGELETSPAVERMAEMLEQQVTEVMPELSDVGAWHSVGQRRTQDELGRIAEDMVPTTFARDGLS